MQAHTSGEVGILGTVLLSVYSGTTFAIFIEIGLYLTEKEQEICWHSFLRHGVHGVPGKDSFCFSQKLSQMTMNFNTLSLQHKNIFSYFPRDTVRNIAHEFDCV